MNINTSVGITTNGKIKVNVGGEDEINISISKDKIQAGRMSYNPRTDKTHVIEITFKEEL